MSVTCTGPVQANRDGELYYFMTGVPNYPPQVEPDRIYFPPAVLPKGVTVTYYGSNGSPVYWDDQINQPWTVIQGAPRWLRLNFDSWVEYGHHEAEIPSYASWPEQRAAGFTPAAQISMIPLKVVATATGEPVAWESINNITVWESKMVELADKYAPQAIDETIDWFYDAGRVYFQIQDFVRSCSRYRDCALGALAGYMKFVIERGGRVSGYHVFSRGLRMGFERTGEAKYADCHKLLDQSPYVSSGGNPDPELIRETAFAADWWIDNEWYGNGRDPRLKQSIDFLLGDLDMLYRQEYGKGVDGKYNLPYMAGLAFEPLIDWYNLTGDRRVIDTIRFVCQYIWDHGVDQTTGAIIYDLWKFPGPAHDDWVCSLNNLITPAYAWLYHVLGDSAFAQMGDFLFSKFDNLEGIDFGAKVFNQNYRWSFAYLQYRG